METQTNGAMDALKTQLLALATELTGEGEAGVPLSQLLAGMVSDVERVAQEPLEIFPVCHHSPASAIHMVRRLQTSAPKVIFLELCEDLQPCLEGLKEGTLPMALQAFAPTSEAFPIEWTPLSVVAPITAFSAEYQAISFCRHNPETTLVFVDRSVDHVFQWMPKKEEKAAQPQDVEDDALPDEEDDGEDLHGSAIGVEVGSMVPTFDRFVEVLIKNAHARNFQEWWTQYVEAVVQSADYATYRNVMSLIGSLIRRLGRRARDVQIDRLRERYMWTRIKDYLRENNLRPQDAMYICGAAHIASDVEEFGSQSAARWNIPERTNTRWLYGVIPSSYLAIERQFGHPSGTISLAENTWKKLLAHFEITSFDFDKNRKFKTGLPPDNQTGLSQFLLTPPAPLPEDEEQLLQWSVEVVAKARSNGYLTSTADSIAVYQTALLLAGIRNRKHPSPWDLIDAAITCLEKNRVPKKRNIQRICEIMLGGDRIGKVSYSSLPTLAKDVYDRLAPLSLNLQSSKVQRALIDFKANPEKRPGSELLWQLRYLLGDYLLHPIMGERTLKSINSTPTQESWEVRMGQRSIIELGYEGVTVEHVLEKRIKKKAFASNAKPLAVLEAAEEAILYLQSLRLVEDIGHYATQRLLEETGGDGANGIVKQLAELESYFMATPTGMPLWLKEFVATGYQHYCSLLPGAFADNQTGPNQLAGMLAFIFKFQSVALASGCNRSQLVIAVQQAHGRTEIPEKQALLWTAEWLLDIRPLAEIREFFDEVLDNPLRVSSVSAYLHGFLLALTFTDKVAGLTVEVLSKAFARLPERTLVVWLPSLLSTLRPLMGPTTNSLFKEVAARFPRKPEDLNTWVPPWNRLPKAEAAPQATPQATGPSLSPTEQAARRMLFAWPETGKTLAPTGEWIETMAVDAPPTAPTAAEDPQVEAARRLLQAHPETAQSLYRA